MPRSRTAAQWRHRIYEILEQGSIGDHTALIVGRLIIALILINLIAVTLESVPALARAYGPWFELIELISLVIFSIEYILRLWVTVEHPPYRHLRPALARWKFATSAQGIIDLLAVLPFWLAFLVPAEFRIVLVFRVVRLLKMARYSPGVRSLLDAIHAERRALLGCLAILMGATLFLATIMHAIERDIQPDKFGTIPDAMWWAIVTLGTVGYGDVVPVSALGKIVAGFAIVGGLIMIALPVGIIANAFATEIHRRDFVVTWNMVARVPLFEELSAADIADIMRLLRAQTVEAGAVIVRRGEPAHSMYFIAAGEVEIDLPNERVRLGVDQFFGEIAVLRRARRSATAIAVTRTSLLVLDARDLHVLMEREPRIAKRLHEMVRSRLGRELVSPRGDIVTEEIDQAVAEASSPEVADEK